MGWVELDWVGLGWVGLGWVGLDWVWVGLRWVAKIVVGFSSGNDFFVTSTPPLT